VADIDVKAYLGHLREKLPYVPPISTGLLKKLHEARDFEGMLRAIKRTMNIEARLIVGWVNSGGPKGFETAPAWIEMPAHMPFYGTSAFKDITIKLFIRRSFLWENSFDRIAIAIAHELAHVVLNSIHHPLRAEEKAVDLAAMLLGFSQLYLTGSHKIEGTYATKHKMLGYLTRSELRAASRILVPPRARTFYVLRTYGLAIIFLGGFCGFLLYGILHAHR
jgi:hypothetical protein